MKHRLLADLFICVFTCVMSLLMAVPAAHALAHAHAWSHRFGSTSDETGKSVAVDASGNVFVAGFFHGTVNFGGVDLVSAGFSDIFLAKYNAAGVHQWSQRFGGTGEDVAYSVAVDASGNVVVTGNFQGSVNFGGGNLVVAGGLDIFVAKYNAAGVHQWSKDLGSGGDDYGNSVAVDASGNVFVTGSFAGTVSFGGAFLVSAGGSDIFVAKYNAAGVHQWSQRFGSASDDAGNSVAADVFGSAIVTGLFQATVNFGGANLVSTGAFDIFLAKYNAAGVHQWSQRFGGTGPDWPYSVGVDALGSIFATGYFNGTVNFGGVNLTSVGGLDIFVAKYNTLGMHQWSQRFGSAGTDVGYSVAADASSNVFVTGYFDGTVNFGGGNLVSGGGSDIFVAKYTAAGVHLWSQRFGSTSSDQGYSVAVDAPGNVITAGYFNGTVDFGGGDLVSAGQTDVFVAKYVPLPAEPVISAITDIGNDQGRRVRIAFSGSGHDYWQSPTPATKYEAYRRNDAVASALTSPPLGASSRESLLAVGWVFAGDVPAHEEAAYLMDAPTDADSTIALGQHYSVFFIRAATAAAGTFFDSPPDSGYSLDNLAPSAPLNLAYDDAQLSWAKSSAEDFDYFTVYGSNTDSFGAATVVDYTVAPATDVSASPYVFYFVTATDFSGNEGKPAKVNTLSGIGGTPTSYALSISSFPNPFNPQTTIRYTVPSRGRITIAVYDTRGAQVTTLVDEEKEAGAYTRAWNGRDGEGSVVGSGVYFIRIAHPAGARSYKMVLLK